MDDMRVVLYLPDTDAVTGIYALSTQIRKLVEALSPLPGESHGHTREVFILDDL
jgi:hypothetical protein